jgi:methionine biosynthesis protein MetW
MINKEESSKLSRERTLRVDLQLVADQIARNSRVLDVGCGDGMLLNYLRDVKEVDGRGLELSMEKVGDAVRRGIPVIQGDLETDLKHYPESAFDYVILSQTLQSTRQPKEVLGNLLRLGKYAIVSFPNFGHWSVRLSLLLHGKMPTTKTLPQNWYNTDNIHLCTIKDFLQLIDELNLSIKSSFALNKYGQTRAFSATGYLANMLCEQAVFVLGRK